MYLPGCIPRIKIKTTENKVYPITDKLPVDTTILSFYKPYKQAIDSQMNVVVANALTEIKRGRPEGKLNNLAADGLALAAKQNNIDFDFLHINYKSLRVQLQPGLIKRFKIFELMPFENYMVVLKLNGSDTNELFQYIAKLGGDPVSGASFRIKSGKAVDIKIQGKDFDAQKTYTILTNDFFANGGDRAVFYTRGTERKNLKLKQRDIFFEYLKLIQFQGKTLNPQIDGRIISDNPVSDE